MRKTGLYIVLGIAISLSIFIFAGILYFRPALRESVEMVDLPVAKEVVAPRAAEVVPPAPAVKPMPVEPVVPKTEQAVAEKSEPAIPVPEVVAEPVAVEPVREAVVEPPQAPPVPAPPALRMTVSAYEAPKAATPVAEPLVVEPEPVVETVEPEVMGEPPVEAPEELAPPRADRVIEPEIYDRPVRRVPALPTVPTQVVSVMPFVRPAPVEYIWTPVAIPEGPAEHVDPVTFSKEAFERRRIAVDEVLEKLVWE